MWLSLIDTVLAIAGGCGQDFEAEQRAPSVSVCRGLEPGTRTPKGFAQFEVFTSPGLAGAR